MAKKKNKLENKVEKASHDFVRKRDGIDGEIRGYCFDCGKYAEGQQFQAGHFEPSGSCGAILRYHPHNMHGQRGGCNMKERQESVKIDYTMKMIKVYGKKRVDEIRSLKNRTIKADDIFFGELLKLYNEGDEEKIVSFLENYPHIKSFTQVAKNK